MNFNIHFKDILCSIRRGSQKIPGKNNRLFLRIMKLTVIFIFILSFSAFSNSLSQVSLSFKQASLEDVLREIRKQTGYAFMVNRADFKESKQVTVNIDNATLEETLEIILKNQLLDYEISGKTISLKAKDRAVLSKHTENLVMAMNVRGRVVDSLGAALVGATVRVLSASGQRTSLTTTTDHDGSFELRNVSEDAQLEVTYVGYVSRKLVPAAEMGQIVLRAMPSALDAVEVMVNTGYQTLPKERATGSFVHIDKNLLESRVTTNIMDQLKDVAPGLQFHNRFSQSKIINIRGINTLRTLSSSPLIIVDNFPYEGDIENINPNDVESVTLLKDAAAASIWGARAANGVIVINLKKPDNFKRANISLTSNASFVQQPDLYSLRKMSSSDFIDVELMLYEKGHYNTQLQDAVSKFYVFSPVVSLLHQASKGLLTEADAMQQINSFRNHDYRDDIAGYMYRTGINQQYALNLDGGADRFSYLLSAGYDDSRKTLAANGSDRLSLRSVNTFVPFQDKRLEIKTSVAYTTSNTESGGGNLFPINPGGGKGELYPYARLFDQDGKALPIPMGYNLDYVATVGDGLLLDWLYRPVEEVDLTQRLSKGNHVALSTSMKYKVWKGLHLELMYGFEKQLNTGQTLYDEESYYARNMVNRFTQINNGAVKRIVPEGGILSGSDGNMSSHRARATANYQYHFSDGSDLTVFAGAEISNKLSRSKNFTAYGYNPNILSYKDVDVINSYPIFDGLAGNARIGGDQSFDGATNRFVSFFANASYEFRRRYIASFSARKDASNSFGVKTNSRWNPLWSAGLAWNMHQEVLLADQDWLDQLKFRVTYGHSGNSGGGNSTPLIIYNSSTASYTNLPYAWLLEPPNPDLKWEDVLMVNYAMDFSVFKNIVSGSLEYFTKHVTDLISNDPVDASTGFRVVTRNVAEIKSKGFDMQLNSANLRGKLTWNSSLGVSFVQDIVTKFYGTVSSTSTYINNAGRSLTPLKDKGLYSVFSYRFVGLDPENGDPIGFLNGSSSKDYAKIMTDSLQNLVYHGSGLPPYYGFFRNNFSWNNIDLSFSFSYKFGAYFRKETINYTSLFNGWASHSDFTKRWMQPGDEHYTSVPSMVYPSAGGRESFYGNSEANIEKSDLVRFQDLRLGYSFNPYLSGHESIRVQVYGAASNLGLVWTANKDGLDPDYEGIPVRSTFSLGLKASF